MWFVEVCKYNLPKAVLEGPLKWHITLKCLKRGKDISLFREKNCDYSHRIFNKDLSNIRLEKVSMRCWDVLTRLPTRSGFWCLALCSTTTPCTCCPAGNMARRSLQRIRAMRSIFAKDWWIWMRETALFWRQNSLRAGELRNWALRS